MKKNEASLNRMNSREMNESVNNKMRRGGCNKCQPHNNRDRREIPRYACRQSDRQICMRADSQTNRQIVEENVSRE